MLAGIKIKKLSPHFDERGLLMEFLRDDDEIFEAFGQVYLTLVKHGQVKAWHFHEHQNDHFVCVEGKALVALYDMRKDSPTFGQSQDFILCAPDIKSEPVLSDVKGELASPKLSGGEHLLVKIPKGVAHGFTAVGCDQAKIVNIPTKHYNYNEPDEIRFPWNDPAINYQWPEDVKSGG